jgi:hypothetical protein
MTNCQTNIREFPSLVYAAFLEYSSVQGTTRS